MAKKRKTRKRRKTATRVIVRRVAAAPRKRKRARKAVGRKVHHKRKTRRRIGALSMKKPNVKSILLTVLDTVKVGGTLKLTKMAYPKVPITNPWLKDGAFYAGGMLLCMLDKQVGVAVAGRALENVLDRVIPGGTPISGRGGVGRLSRDEVDMIERAALSDRVSGITEETVLGSAITYEDML